MMATSGNVYLLAQWIFVKFPLHDRVHTMQAVVVTLGRAGIAGGYEHMSGDHKHITDLCGGTALRWLPEQRAHDLHSKTQERYRQMSCMQILLNVLHAAVTVHN